MVFGDLWGASQPFSSESECSRERQNATAQLRARSRHGEGGYVVQRVQPPADELLWFASPFETGGINESLLRALKQTDAYICYHGSACRPP